MSWPLSAGGNCNGWLSGPTTIVIPAMKMKIEADREQHLVELAGAIEPAIEQPLEHDAERGGGEKAERRAPAAKPKCARFIASTMT